MAGVAGGAASLAEGLIVAVALGDVGIGPAVVADTAASAAVADHGGGEGPWVAVFAAGEGGLSNHLIILYLITRGDQSQDSCRLIPNDIARIDISERIHRTGLHDVEKVLVLLMIEVHQVLIEDVDPVEFEAFGLVPSEQPDRAGLLKDMLGVANGRG